MQGQGFYFILSEMCARCAATKIFLNYSIIIRVVNMSNIVSRMFGCCVLASKTFGALRFEHLTFNIVMK